MTEKLIIRELSSEDAKQLLQMYIDNKEYFGKWCPVKPDDSFYTLEGQLKKINDSQERSQRDEYYSFGIFLEEDNILIGDLSFSFVHRGPLQSAMIGYEIAQKYTGKGYATKAILLALDIGFNKLHFHRIVAEAHPDNIGSIRVLEKAGFRKEGHARKNLKLNGEWQDNVCMAILDEEVD